MQLDRPVVRMTAIKAVVDILMYHGSTAFDDDDDDANQSDEDLFIDEEAEVGIGVNFSTEEYLQVLQNLKKNVLTQISKMG